jgi:membrane-associated phospholipid phosphatase
MTDRSKRRRQAFVRRNRAARQQLLAATFRSDEGVDDDPVTNFGKALEHDDDGVPTGAAYESLVEAIESDGVEAFNDILRADSDGRPRRLIQPHASQSFQKTGADPWMTRIRSHPSFSSDRTGAEMVELYWRALCRDVPYGDYDSNGVVGDAVSELGGLPGYRGPGSAADSTSGALEPTNLFRGVLSGAQTGPRISQFLWKDIPRGAIPLSQRNRVLTGAAATATFESGETTLTLDGPDYLTDFDDWFAIQNGVPVEDVNPPPNLVTKSNDPDDQVSRHIVTGRDLANKVRRQVPYLSIRDAAEILLEMGVPKDPYIPYEQRTTGASATDGIDGIRTCKPFLDFGSHGILDVVVNVFMHGQNAAWYRKWDVFRRLRPEEYAGRIHAAEARGRSFDLPRNVLGSTALSRIVDEHGSYLLPQAYTEGSPTHPSFPAGHSVVAGATVTALKAMFDGSYEFSNDELMIPVAAGSTDAALAGGGTTDVVLTELEPLSSADVDGGTIAATAEEIDDARVATVTVKDELNKLAANMAFGRNWAGIHYRTDGIDGFLIGEQAAVRYLQDHIRHHDLPFDGYRLEPFFDAYPGTQEGARPNVDGGSIVVRPDEIVNDGSDPDIDVDDPVSG